MAQSLRKVENNIKDLSSYPGFEVNLNLESLLTLNVENQHAVTHFKKETFTLYEYAQIFGSSVEEGVKRVTPWSAHYYTHPSSNAEPSAAGQLVSVEIPKPVGERLSRNEEAEMRLWAKRFCEIFLFIYCFLSPLLVSATTACFCCGRFTLGSSTTATYLYCRPCVGKFN